MDKSYEYFIIRNIKNIDLYVDTVGYDVEDIREVKLFNNEKDARSYIKVLDPPEDYEVIKLKINYKI